MIDFTKPIQTRDGRKAEFVRMLKCVDQQALVIVTQDDGTERAEMYSLHGEYYLNSNSLSTWDLINVPVKHKRKYFMNFYPSKDSTPCAYLSREAADDYAADNRIACVELESEFTEGEGL